jgi:hypothetical protein
MFTGYAQLQQSIVAFKKGGAEVRLPAGTMIRQPFQAAGATHFLASADGVRWAAYYTTEALQTAAA